MNDCNLDHCDNSSVCVRVCACVSLRVCEGEYVLTYKGVYVVCAVSQESMVPDFQS